MAYRYDRSVLLSQSPNIIDWLQRKADEAGPDTTQVSGLDCKVASDMMAGLLAEVERLQTAVTGLEEEKRQLVAGFEAVNASLRVKSFFD